MKIALAALVVAACLPLLLPGPIVYLLALTLITAIALLGLNYITANCGLISVGHAAIQGIGAYATVICATKLHAPVALALLAGVVAAALIGLIIAIPSVRLSGPYFAVITLALGWAVPQFATVAAPLTGGFSGIYVDPFRVVGSATTTMYLLALLLLALVIWMQRNLDRSHFGAALLLQKTSVHAARSLGVHTTVTKVLAVTFANALAGLSGGLLLYLVTDISPGTFSFVQSALFLAGAIIGGVRSPFGALIGAGFMVLIPQALSGSSALGGVILGLLLFGTLVALPGGIVSLFANARPRAGAPAPKAAP